QAVLVSTLVLSLAGLFSPLAVVVAFIWNRPKLRADIADRLKWPAAERLPWVLAAVLLVPVSLLVAQGVSLFFGYGLDQFSLRGGFTFSTGLMPAWATLIGAAIIEELAWHSYGTDTLVRKMRVFSASMLFTLMGPVARAPVVHRRLLSERGRRVGSARHPQFSHLDDRLRAGDELAVLPLWTQHPGARDLPRLGEHVRGAVHDAPRLENHPDRGPAHLLGSDRHQRPVALLRPAGGCLDLQISHKRSGFTGRRAFPSEHDHRRKRVCPLVFVGAFTSVLVVDTDPRNLPARPYPHRIPHRGIVPEGRYCTLTWGIS